MTVSLQWLGHSCFKVEKDGYSIVIDPYKDDSVPGLRPLRVSAHQVLCTHTHDDHYGMENVSILNTDLECPFEIEKMTTFHDKEQGKLRGTNTIFLFTSDEGSIMHLGDLGCIEELPYADVVLVPVGGYYTLEPREMKKVIDSMGPKVVIPIHYRSQTFGYDEIEAVDTYLSLCENVKTYSSTIFEFDEQTPSGTVVLDGSKL